MNRRNLLAAALALSATPAALPTAAAAPATIGPDAALIKDCRELERLEQHLCCTIRACEDLADEGWPQQVAINDAMRVQAARIVAAQATTLEGMQAKARALMAYGDEPPNPEAFTYQADRLRASLLRDLLAGVR